jgi:probable HAF family extracellular repeat protein
MDRGYWINDAGVVVGDYTPDGGGSYFDFRYSAGALATFGVPGAASISICRPNCRLRDWRVHTSGFLYEGSSFTSLNVPGASRTWAYGINDVGQIVGAYSEGGTASHGFIFQNGNYTTLDRPSFASTGFLRINNAGQITGFSNENIGSPSAASFWIQARSPSSTCLIRRSQ